MTAVPFCSDCPDHEACATGWSCRSVRESVTWLPTLQLQLAQVGVTSEAGL